MLPCFSVSWYINKSANLPQRHHHYCILVFICLSLLFVMLTCLYAQMNWWCSCHYSIKAFVCSILTLYMFTFHLDNLENMSQATSQTVTEWSISWWPETCLVSIWQTPKTSNLHRSLNEQWALKQWAVDIPSIITIITPVIFVFFFCPVWVTLIRRSRPWSASDAGEVEAHLRDKCFMGKKITAALFLSPKAL